MFKFTDFLGRKRFLWASLLRVGLFVGSVFGFPFFLLALATITNCRSVGGACGAIGVIGAMAFKPLAFVLFVFSFVGISMRRARDAGVPSWIGLFIPLLFAADYTFLVFTGTPWGFGFSAGVLRIPVPYYTLLALGCIAVLSALPPRADLSSNPFGYAGWVALGLGIFVATFAAWGAALTLPGALPYLLPLARALRYVGWLLPYAMIALFAVLVWIAWQERGHVMAAPRRPLPKASTGSRLATLVLVAVAAVLTIVALELSLPNEFALPIIVATQFATMVLPTFVIYFCALLALFLVITRRTAKSVAFILVALLPFAHWVYARWTTSLEHEHEIAEIAAIPTTRAQRIPATAVIESSQTSGMRAVWNIKDIEYVIVKGAYGQRLMQFERPPARGQSRPPVEALALPDEYLLLRVGQSSSFAKNRQVYATAGGPLELRIVAAGRNELIAVWYRAFNPSPSGVPLLTVAGWFRGQNSATTDQVDATIAAFLTRALLPAGQTISRFPS